MINNGSILEENAEFDLDAWQNEWATIENEMKAVTRANEIAEGPDSIIFSDTEVISISNTLALLAAHRTVFHSEADFQHAFAWELQRQLPGANVRLELPLRTQAKSIHLDILVTQNHTALAIELKYKTRKFSQFVNNEQFSLADQSAQDIARYDFVKDIERLEQVIDDRVKWIGYAILLTNDSAYWVQPGSRATVDADFRLHQGRLLHGELQWDAKASKGTTKNREKLLKLNGTYAVNWIDYSQLKPTGYGMFRYVAVEVH